jgi:hypothetical protein
LCFNSIVFRYWLFSFQIFRGILAEEEPFLNSNWHQYQYGPDFKINIYIWNPKKIFLMKFWQNLQNLSRNLKLKIWSPYSNFAPLVKFVAIDRRGKFAKLSQNYVVLSKMLKIFLCKISPLYYPVLGWLEFLKCRCLRPEIEDWYPLTTITEYWIRN